MHELSKKTQELLESVKTSMARLGLGDLENKKKELEAKAASPDFWQKSQNAAQVMQNISDLEGQIQPWLDLEKNLREIKELADLDDDSLSGDLEKQFESGI
jgi:hypothetical protein